MSVRFTLDSRAVPEGTVLLFGVKYAGPDQEGIAREPTEEAKVYTYAMIKAGGFWYVTGGGRTPQAAGWGAVERWLERDGRVVEWVRHVTETCQLWPFTIKPHRFEASYSGMVCGAMVEDVNGNGDQCGRPAGDPVHQGGEAGQPARVAAPA
jgi:hypothetical protein